MSPCSEQTATVNNIS